MRSAPPPLHGVANSRRRPLAGTDEEVEKVINATHIISGKSVEYDFIICTAVPYLYVASCRRAIPKSQMPDPRRERFERDRERDRDRDRRAPSRGAWLAQLLR